MARPAWEVLFTSSGTDFRQDVNRNIRVQRNFNRTINNANQGFRSFNRLQAQATNALRGFFAVVAGGGLFALGRGIVNMVDSVRVLEGQLRAGTEELGNFYQAQDELQGLADQTRQGIDILTRGYSQLALSADRATLSHENVVLILETFSNAARIGGSSADDLSEALRQMGQAAAEGRVQWEDLTIIMDRLVGIRATLNRYAQGRDTTLRTLTSTGFSFDELLQALQQDRTRLSQSAGGAADTVSNSFNRLVASVRQAAAELDGLLGITEGIADAFENLQTTIENIDLEKLATEVYALFIDLRNVVKPLSTLFRLVGDTTYLKNLIVILVRFADLIAVILALFSIGRVGAIRLAVGGFFRAVRSGASRLGSALLGVVQTLIRALGYLARFRILSGIATIIYAIQVALQFMVGSVGAFTGSLVLLLRVISEFGVELWKYLLPPPDAENALFNLRIEVRKLSDELRRAKGEIGGESGFQRLFREALLVEGFETPQQQAQQDASKALDARVAKMKEFLLQNKELSATFIRQSAEARNVLLIFEKWGAEATFLEGEIERLEEALANAEDSTTEGKISAELRELRKRADEANKEVAGLRETLTKLFDAYVRNNLQNLEGAFKGIKDSFRVNIKSMQEALEDLRDDLNDFALSNDISDAFQEVRRLLAIPEGPGFTHQTALQIFELLRSGREEQERTLELADREVYRRGNALHQARIELDLAKEKQKLGEGNVQELQKEVKAREEGLKNAQEQLDNARRLRDLANERLKAYIEESKILEEQAGEKGRTANQNEAARLNIRNRLLKLIAESEKGSADHAERRRKAQEALNRLLQIQAALYQQIRGFIEQIGTNLLDQLLLKTQSWGDFLRENLRLLAQFILRLTLIQPLAERIASFLYPQGASAVSRLAGIAVPVAPVPTPVGGGQGGAFSGVPSPKPVVLRQTINVDAVDAAGVRRVMRGEAQRIAQETANLIQGGRNYY